jgi:hypothetical protein
LPFYNFLQRRRSIYMQILQMIQQSKCVDQSN